VLVTTRVVTGLPSLRRRGELAVLIGAFRDGCAKEGFRMVQYSVQSNHLHFIVEGANRLRVTRGVQGLLIRIAKRLNKQWRRRGRVFADRFHDRVLKSPRAVKIALRYVLNNGRKHGAHSGRGPDPCSSGRWFDGWRDYVSPQWAFEGPVASARTWLVTTGWRRCGRIGVREVPGPNGA
jgi:REP element-mobilizing transposase RayT